MIKSEQRYDAHMPEQVEFWNYWNAKSRERGVGIVSIEQANIISSWLQRIGRTDLGIIDIGCGAGWLCNELTRFGKVTGTDLADKVLERAAKRVPSEVYCWGLHDAKL